MSGYDWGKGMSNNAVYAYENNEKPYSKWSKSDFIDYAKTRGWDLVKLRKCRLSSLKSILLRPTHRHHTSKFYNYTMFYEIDEDISFDDVVSYCVGDETIPKKYKLEIGDIVVIKYNHEDLIDMIDRGVKPGLFMVLGGYSYKFKSIECMSLDNRITYSLGIDNIVKLSECNFIKGGEYTLE